MSKLTKTVLQRPVAAMVIVASLIIFGINSIMGMNLQLIPDMDMPVMLVITTYPQAGPEDVERLVTKSAIGEFDRQIKAEEERIKQRAELDALLPQADVVALALPHSPQTAGLMDGRRIALMKDDAILISAGRGSVLNQEALAAAMGGGKLWGAALDVTSPEPLPPDSPLWDLPNLLLTPHVAGGMRLELTRRRCVEMAQENLRRYLAGEKLVNLVQ